MQHSESAEALSTDIIATIGIIRFFGCNLKEIFISIV
jgi:hypothetical protein